MSPLQLLPEAARRTSAWCIVVLLVIAVAAVFIKVCLVLQAAVTPVLLALLGTALLRPLYSWLVRCRLNRSLAAFLTCLAVLIVVGGTAYIVVSALIDSGQQIAGSVREIGDSLSGHLGQVGTSYDELVERAKKMAGKYGGSAASGVLTGLSVAAETGAAALLALFLVFFFLRDADRARKGLRSLAPSSNSADVLESVGRRAFGAVEGFMRGTTIIALIDAVLITIGLLVLRVPGAVGLGALVFIGAYIPYLGAFLSGTLAVVVALADGGLAVALWMLGVVVLVQFFEGHVLQPVIQSRTVHMHPAVVLIALAAGASLAGILGMLLAVPLTAAGFGVFHELRSRLGGGNGGNGNGGNGNGGNGNGGGGTGEGGGRDGGHGAGGGTGDTCGQGPAGSSAIRV